MIERLSSFCRRLGGRVEDVPLPSDFSCDVDPSVVIRNFEEFKRIARELRKHSREITRVFFGKPGAYFYIYPREGEAGFVISKEIIPISENIEYLAKDIEREWYEHLRKYGLEPGFHYIPDFVWDIVDEKTHSIDLYARVLYPDLDILDNVANAMLEYKKKVEELISKYGAVEI
jgi:hypothetical protein